MKVHWIQCPYRYYLTVDSVDATLDAFIARLPPPTSFGDFRLRTVEYDLDGDDATNLRADYIASASHVRALNFGITPLDFATIRRVSGKIVPRVITTAAVAAGLACLEYYKVSFLLKSPIIFSFAFLDR